MKNNGVVKNVTKEMSDYDVKRCESILRNAHKIAGLKICEVDVDLLNFDEAYQRPTKNAHKLVDNFDINRVNLLLLSYRDGKLYVVDGSHRTYAARHHHIEHLPCMVMEGLTQAEEARIFASQNECVVNLTLMDTFRANLISKEPVDTAINSICDNYGLKVGYGRKNNEYMSAIGMARTCVKNEGAACFDWILGVIKDSGWIYESGSTSDAMIRGLYHVYREHKSGNKLTEAKYNLVKTFIHSNPSQIISYARASRPNLEKRASIQNTIMKIANGECVLSDITKITE